MVVEPNSPTISFTNLPLLFAFSSEHACSSDLLTCCCYCCCFSFSLLVHISHTYTHTLPVALLFTAH